MRFMIMYTPDKKPAGPPSPGHMAEMEKFIDQEIKAGVLITTGGLQASAKGARVRLADGKLTLTDGPFAEAKEVVGGFAIIQAESKEEAVEASRRFLKVAGDGVCEVRGMEGGR